MPYIVNYLELSGLFKKIVNDEFVIYRRNNHSIMIPKDKESTLYLLYKGNVITVFTLVSNNLDTILDRLKLLFEGNFITGIGLERIKFLSKDEVKNNYIYDLSINRIYDTNILDKYKAFLIKGNVVFVNLELEEVVYIIESNKQEVKEKENMPTKNYHYEKSTNNKKRNDKLKNIFNKVTDMTSHKFQIGLELLKIGCKHLESEYIFKDSIIIRLDEKDLYLSVKNTDIKDIPFKLSETTLDEVIEYLEGIYN